MKILGIILLYHPPVDVIDNILSYLAYMGEEDKLIVWSNSSHDKIIFPEKYKEQEEKIIEMGDGSNVGFAAYNIAVKYAREHHYTHLLTMDQDSRFKDNDFQKYVQLVSQANENAIFSPNRIIHGEKRFVEQDSFIEVEETISSGCLIPVDVFDEIGLFRDDFFIYAIDVEFSLRAKKYGIPTKMVPSASMFHEGGYQKTKHKFLWKTFFPNEYSPVSSYYLVRNSLIIQRLYPGAKCLKGLMYGFFYKRLFFVLCYESNKWAKWKGLLLGYVHGKMRKTGKQTIFNETDKLC
jgi:rhamnosyltransferase